ncbi:G-type lectin S-receptor-like serine/threonine-protein kinase SD2-5 [Impatiens glandulifera]|uniref:G-type lectin S-receptor-like serine/threonine-protein kinase SD2-5 n=1 Tax=Impatiens glandulifera TaxID=253017 RepID=UPI001FB0B059|nr:G-type lectin S-receptor-like serine/threonine-protein kinase SD2-5 [Impatiens glandulifera]
MDHKIHQLQPSIIFMILFLLSSPSYLISLKIDQPPSEYVFPSINTTTSTSWMINQLPSVWLNSTSYGFDFFKSILLKNSSSSGSQFISGFSCNFFNTSCFFGIIIILQNNILDDDFSDNVIYNDPVMIWSANRNYPLQGNATLKFTSKGDLILANADDKLVWSTNTTGNSVLGFKLTETGNLILFGDDHSIVWQSFDHPTDTLVRGQILLPGQKLIASQSTDSLNEGLYSLTREKQGCLVAYIESNPPQVYFNSSTTIQEYNTDKWFQSILEQNASTNLTYQFSKLEANGHFNFYNLGKYEPKILNDPLQDQIRDCDHPMACGRYGLCSGSNQCSCPEEVKNGSLIIRPLDYRKPNIGCTLSTNISCADSQYHSLVELKNTTYFNFFQRQNNMNVSLQDCKLACLRNCSCKALVYSHYYYSHNGDYFDDQYFGKVYPCLLINEVFSLKAIDVDSQSIHISLFLKVQEQVSYPQKSLRRATSTAASIIAGTIITICLLLSIFFFVYKRRKMVKKAIEHHLPQLSGLTTRFSYDQLKSITCNFSTKLGEGGFGSVFEGTLSNGIKVAVKSLDGFDQLKKSFLAEVETIGNIHHVNLVKLIGYCAEDSYTLLIYEYMSNGSLDKWIFYKNQEVRLNWELRKKIIIDIAKGLAYLHEDCRQKILHLDIKPQNILLDENFNAKISDFGLAKLVEKDHSQIITALRGTPGYIAPEWLSLNITEKVDVYSFGVVVMEILCGRPNLDRSQIEDNKHLLGMFKRMGEEGRLQDLIDKDDLEMQSNIEEVVKIIKLAAWCLQSDFSRRPPMTNVVKVLECVIEVENNLDYNFTNPPIRNVTTNPDVKDSATTPLFPSILSGPR